MRTLIVSDLHLGSLSGSDLLRSADVRTALLEHLAEVDRLVLLGDVLELRHGPLRESLSAARPFFEALGGALRGRELVLVAGNHDHALIDPWVAARGELERPGPLALEQLIAPAGASRAYATIAEWAGPARTVVAYPGLWVREDVYATHGHYLDCHLTVPTLERLSVGAMWRLLGRSPEDFAGVDDYELVGAPVFAWRDAVARETHTGSILNGVASVAAWDALGGPSGDGKGNPGTTSADSRAPLSRRVRRRALLAGFPLAVAALNRAGLGPLRADISGPELRRAGLRAMGEVAARLDIGDRHLVFGHTHRTGPLPGDDLSEWRGRGGARLLNAGNWTYAEVFLRAAAGESPYWPGGGVLVDGDDPPAVVRLLQDRRHDELRAAARATREALRRSRG